MTFEITVSPNGPDRLKLHSLHLDSSRVSGTDLHRDEHPPQVRALLDLFEVVSEHDDFANVNCTKTCKELLGYLTKEDGKTYARQEIGGGITVSRATLCLVGLRAYGVVSWCADKVNAATVEQDPTSALPQTINGKLCDGTILIGYGKRGHGMNGKDADLDRIGQCLVRSLTTIPTEDPANHKVRINLRLYASICAPTGEGIWWESMPDCSPELKEFFRDHHGIDLSKELDYETDSAAMDTITEHFLEQATSIVCGMRPGVGDFMWNDDCWDGGTDITLEVPLPVSEHEAIEAGDEDTLATVAQRISQEIYDGNEGGTPARDAMKEFEEEVGLANDLINSLECYGNKRGEETPA